MTLIITHKGKLYGDQRAITISEPCFPVKKQKVKKILKNSLAYAEVGVTLSGANIQIDLFLGNAIFRDLFDEFMGSLFFKLKKIGLEFWSVASDYSLPNDTNPKIFNGIIITKKSVYSTYRSLAILEKHSVDAFIATGSGEVIASALNTTGLPTEEIFKKVSLYDKFVSKEFDCVDQKSLDKPYGTVIFTNELQKQLIGSISKFPHTEELITNLAYVGLFTHYFCSCLGSLYILEVDKFNNTKKDTRFMKAFDARAIETGHLLEDRLASLAADKKLSIETLTEALRKAIEITGKNKG